MSENIVDHETAEAEFQRFGELMALDFNVDKMDMEDKTAFDQIKDRLITAIEQGHLVVDEEGQMVYTPWRTAGFTDPITFHEPTGGDLVQMDKKKIGQNIGMTFAVAASMARQSPSLFTKLKGLDYKICLGITNLFLD